MAGIEDVNNANRAALIAANNAVVIDLSKPWRQVEADLNSAIQALALEVVTMQRDGKTINQAKLLQLDRMRELLAQLTKAMRVYGDDAAPMINDHVDKTGRIGVTGSRRLIQAVGVPANRLIDVPDSLLEQVAKQIRNNQPLSKLLERAYPIAAQGIIDQIIAGTTSGVNPRDLAQRIKRAGLAQGLEHILLVGRDQGNRSWRESGRQSMAMNGVKKYRRTASKQDRTCIACLALDGTIYPVDELMPLHAQDRCSLVPIVEGFPPPRIQSGKDWIAALPESRQKAILGPRRFEAFKNGRDLEDMITISDSGEWGKSTKIKPLR